MKVAKIMASFLTFLKALNICFYKNLFITIIADDMIKVFLDNIGFFLSSTGIDISG